MAQLGCQGLNCVKRASMTVQGRPRVGEVVRAFVQGCDGNKRRFFTHRALGQINILRIMKISVSLSEREVMIWRRR